MKSFTFAVAAASLLQFSAAQPHRHRQAVHQHQKKDVVVTVTDIVYPTNGPEVIVYVDQFDIPRSTTTSYLWGTVEAASSTSSSSTSTSSSYVAPAAPSSSSVAPAIAPAVVAAASSSSYVAPVVTVATSTSSTPIPSSTSVYVAPTTSSTSVAPVATTSSSAAAASTSATAEAGGYGFSYNAYRADGTCKTQDDVNMDFAGLPSGYTMVRTYGTDCDQVTTVLSAAMTYGYKLFAGVYYLDTLTTDLQTMISAANAAGGWSAFDTISIGNELVDTGKSTAAEVIAALSTARTTLTAAGFTGHVVTVDTLAATLLNPSLCDESDYCAVNCHPFFDQYTSSSEAGTFINTQVGLLRAVLANANQEVVITETGWPWQGTNHGDAVVSLADQTTAISSIKGNVSLKTILLSAYNDLWKTTAAATYDAEKYWGIGGINAPSDS
ncbi:hypothetical protein BP5796_07237 [Coleophoma crateriformis]|uniref:Glycoside hydrolase family 17 protein n=1 Tax=Coleophoma crateriformis TaxID=565419 RepID=A0A3D8RIC2_9HELO|nr:hypothetical protein BP5796_07237 [Coleophoma crateriformis]